MRKFLQKIVLMLGSLAILALPFSTSAATIDELNQQKNAATQQAATAQQKAKELASQASFLNDQISNLNAQIYDIQRAIDATDAQIKETEAAIADLSNQIKIQEEQLAAENMKLNDIAASWYMEGDNNSLTNAILSSNTLSEVVTKQEYYDSIRQQIEDTVNKINQLKDQLNQQKTEQENKKAELDRLQAENEGNLRAIQSQKSTKATLLSGTNQQKQDYLQKAASAQAEADRVTAQIAALRAQQDRDASVQTGGTGGYPFSGIDQPDPWGFLTRECTSYAAWYWNNVLGKSWYNTRPGSGSAYNWSALAYDQGYSVSSTPRVGAIISWRMSASMPYGHVAIVQAVNGNGTIDVSEYNWVSYAYSYRSNVDPSRYGSYSYIY